MDGGHTTLRPLGWSRLFRYDFTLGFGTTQPLATVILCESAQHATMLIPLAFSVAFDTSNHAIPSGQTIWGQNWRNCTAGFCPYLDNQFQKLVPKILLLFHSVRSHYGDPQDSILSWYYQKKMLSEVSSVFLYFIIFRWSCRYAKLLPAIINGPVEGQ